MTTLRSASRAMGTRIITAAFCNLNKVRQQAESTNVNAFVSQSALVSALRTEIDSEFSGGHRFTASTFNEHVLKSDEALPAPARRDEIRFFAKEHAPFWVAHLWKRADAMLAEAEFACVFYAESRWTCVPMSAPSIQGSEIILYPRSSPLGAGVARITRLMYPVSTLPATRYDLSGVSTHEDVTDSDLAWVLAVSRVLAGPTFATYGFMNAGEWLIANRNLQPGTKQVHTVRLPCALAERLAEAGAVTPETALDPRAVSDIVNLLTRDIPAPAEPEQIAYKPEAGGEAVIVAVAATVRESIGLARTWAMAMLDWADRLETATPALTSAESVRAAALVVANERHYTGAVVPVPFAPEMLS